MRRALAAPRRRARSSRAGPTAAATSPASAAAVRLGPTTNVTASIEALLPRRLLHVRDHPLNIVKTTIADAFPGFRLVDDLSPVVTTRQTFDDLLIPADHAIRKRSDTFYVDEHRVLRPHTSAHQTELLRSGLTEFLVAGDVYRRDEIDATHFPAFHQMEGVKVLPPGATRADAFEDLKRGLDRVCDALFGRGGAQSRRWIDAYFPFTDPSAELEVRFRDRDVEVLGCGVVHAQIMRAVGMPDRAAWAFGLGLERLAMVVFDIPDIRLFWTTDPRFSDQFVGGLERFRSGDAPKFRPFSKYPSVTKDVSFWLPPLADSVSREFSDNDVYSIVRDVAREDVESVAVLDKFTHPKTGRESRAYRVVYRSMTRNLTHEEVNAMQDAVRASLRSALHAELR